MNTTLNAALESRYFKVSMLWATSDKDIDKSTWLDPDFSGSGHGPRMNPNKKTGQMAINVAMDARNNHGTLRTKESMIEWLTKLAVQAGFQDPESRAKGYFKSWVNEGLIKPVEVVFEDHWRN